MTARRVLTVVDVVKGAVHEFLADNCPHLSAAISYYLLLSLFPLVLAAISVFGLIVQKPGVEARVIEAVVEFIPVSADFIANAIRSASANWQTAGIIAIVGLVWVGMAFFNAIRKSLNTAWGVRKPRPFFQERLIELLMMIGFGVLMLISFGLTTSFKVVRQVDLPIFDQHIIDGAMLWQAAVIGISVFVTFLAFLFLYKLVPNTNVQWRHAALGAAVAAVLFEVAKNLFIWFVADSAAYRVVYGYVGTVIALMAWAYVSAAILLFCAKLTSTYPRVKASLAKAELASGSTREKRHTVAPAAITIIANVSSVTSGGVGALRRLMQGRKQ